MNVTFVTETSTESVFNPVATGVMEVEENVYLYSTQPWIIGIVSGIIAGIAVKFAGRKILKCKYFS